MIRLVTPLSILLVILFSSCADETTVDSTDDETGEVVLFDTSDETAADNSTASAQDRNTDIEWDEDQIIEAAAVGLPVGKVFAQFGKPDSTYEIQDGSTMNIFYAPTNLSIEGLHVGGLQIVHKEGIITYSSVIKRRVSVGE